MTLPEPESTRDKRRRLAPVLATLEAMDQSVFLDLCELVVMVSEKVTGMIKFTTPRVVVHIKLPKKAKAAGTKRKA